MKQGYEAELGAIDTEYHDKHIENDSDYEVSCAPLKTTYTAKRQALFAEKKAKHDALFAKYEEVAK